MSAIVHVVHCIDTEGPLHESLEATFERLRAIFDIDLPPDAATLRQLQNAELDLGGIEAQVARVIAPDLLDYNHTWDKLDAMLERVMAAKFRTRTKDSFGGGWVYNWFCVDHVGYATNPRDRDLGQFHIHDHYRAMIAKTGSDQDALHFHFHPVSFAAAGNHAATRYFNDGGRLYDILARYVIDKQWFPCAYRPGFHSERPDSHWFLEQHVPFDYANQATVQDLDAQQLDISGGRFGDWRRAPVNWQPYHPAHDDHQTPGDCRRWIMRCLNVGTRLRLLDQGDVDQAFQEASDGKPTVLAFANHDYRDIAPDVTRVMDMLHSATERHPGVRFKFSEARAAAREALDLRPDPAFALDLALTDNRIDITATTPTFGPQPFLALKTKDGAYHHDNLDMGEPFKRWSYTLDEQTLPMERIEKIGVAACDGSGAVSVAVFDAASGQVNAKTF